MANVGFSVCGRRSIIKGIGLAFLTVVDTLFKNVIFFPELFDLLFPVYEVQIGRYFFVHEVHPFFFETTAVSSHFSQLHS